MHRVVGLLEVGAGLLAEDDVAYCRGSVIAKVEKNFLTGAVQKINFLKKSIKTPEESRTDQFGRTTF